MFIYLVYESIQHEPGDTIYYAFKTEQQAIDFTEHSISGFGNYGYKLQYAHFYILKMKVHGPEDTFEDNIEVFNSKGI